MDQRHLGATARLLRRSVRVDTPKHALASLAAAAAGLMLASACATVPPPGARQAEVKARAQGAAVTQAELQQDLERFSGQFADRLNDAMGPLLRSPNAEVRETALRQQLAYFASALDIATESQPELGLLDMIVFVTLAHERVRDYWVPDVWGDAGQATEQAFARSNDQIWQIASKILNAQKRETLVGLIDAWRARNPNQRSVEAVRFSDFAMFGGEGAGDRDKASGLLATVQSAAEAADAAVLLGERAIFMTHRLPFVLRLQARVGTGEIIGDTARDFSGVSGTLDRLAELRPMVQDMSAMAKQSTAAAEETRRLIESLRPLLKENGLNDPSGTTGLPRQLEQANALADKSLKLTTELSSLTSQGDRDVSRQLDRWMRRSLLYLLLVGAILITLFWLGYYIARRFADDHARGDVGGRRGAGGAQLHPR
jgi:hypothetical protein